MNLPPDATVLQPQLVAGEIAEAVPDALDLDEQVHGFGRPIGAAVGGMEGEDLGLPRPDRAGKAGQLATPTPSNQR